MPLMGFESSVVYYDSEARFAGESKYPLTKMVALAMDAVTSFSVVTLCLITPVGFLVFFFAACMSVFVLWVRLFTDVAVRGWASTEPPRVYRRLICVSQAAIA